MDLHPDLRIGGCLSICLSFLDFLTVELLAIYRPPGVGAVGDDDGYEERHPEHGAQGGFAAGAVGDGERALQVGVRRIEGSVVPSGHEEEHDDGEDDADPGGPDALDIVFPEQGAPDAVEQEPDAGEQCRCERPLLEQVVQVFHWLHEDDARGGVFGKAVLQEGADEEGEEEHEERGRVHGELWPDAGTDGLVGDVVVYI